MFKSTFKVNVCHADIYKERIIALHGDGGCTALASGGTRDTQCEWFIYLRHSRNTILRRGLPSDAVGKGLRHERCVSLSQ